MIHFVTFILTYIRTYPNIFSDTFSNIYSGREEECLTQNWESWNLKTLTWHVGRRGKKTMYIYIYIYILLLFWFWGSLLNVFFRRPLHGLMMIVCVFMFRWFVLARGVADSSLSHRKGEHRALCHGWGSPVAAEIPLRPSKSHRWWRFPQHVWTLSRNNTKSNRD